MNKKYINKNKPFMYVFINPRGGGNTSFPVGGNILGSFSTHQLFYGLVCVKKFMQNILFKFFLNIKLILNLYL